MLQNIEIIDFCKAWEGNSLRGELKKH
uniref:Uncharacterized protein n=1 Tax=Anopheles quadriannulatus TaxID=34691 RepID=A0A182XU03_ANOQN